MVSKFIYFFFFFFKLTKKGEKHYVEHINWLRNRKNDVKYDFNECLFTRDLKEDHDDIKANPDLNGLLSVLCRGLDVRVRFSFR